MFESIFLRTILINRSPPSGPRSYLAEKYNKMFDGNGAAPANNYRGQQKMPPQAIQDSKSTIMHIQRNNISRNNNPLDVK